MIDFYFLPSHDLPDICTYMKYNIVDEIIINKVLSTLRILHR